MQFWCHSVQFWKAGLIEGLKFNNSSDLKKGWHNVAAKLYQKGKKVQLQLANIKRNLLLPFAFLWIILLFASHAKAELIEQKAVPLNYRNSNKGYIKRAFSFVKLLFK